MKITKLMLVLLLAVPVLTGCDRSFTEDIVSVTPPELHVFVEDAAGGAVAGAAVAIYASAEDLENNTNALVTGTTDAQGKVVATESDLKEPGVFHVRATKDGLAGSAATPYILLTDGQTYFQVVVE